MLVDVLCASMTIIELLFPYTYLSCCVSSCTCNMILPAPQLKRQCWCRAVHQLQQEGITAAAAKCDVTKKDEVEQV